MNSPATAYRCQACRTRGKTWTGSDPRCAFPGPDAGFSPDNFVCATLDGLRDLVHEGQDPMPAGVDYRYCEDQKYATIKIDHIECRGEPIGLALWVSWYKSRGGTDAVWVLSDDQAPRRPTEAEVLAIVADYAARACPAPSSREDVLA